MTHSLVAALRRFTPTLLGLALAMGALATPVASVLGAQEVAAPGQAPRHVGGEANLVIPDLSSVDFLGVNGHTLLMSGILISALGLLFGLVIYSRLKNLPVHQSMREISELIYETCKTYLVTQGKFILLSPSTRQDAFLGLVLVLLGIPVYFIWRTVETT